MKKVLILYSTFTDNTKEAATALRGALEKEMPECRFSLSNIRGTSIQKISEYSLVIFGASTWEDGNSPDTEKFLGTLHKTTANFSRTTFALFGLGDSAYLNFCAAVPLVKCELELRNAHIYPKIFTIDGYPTEIAIKNLITWAKSFLLEEMEK